MKKENKFLDVVESYYKVFKVYNDAYENLGDSRDSLTNTLKPLLKKSDSRDEDFRKASKDYIAMLTSYPQDVGFYAGKFLHAADIYMVVTKEDLPEEIAMSYIKLKANEYKPAYSIKEGKFVRNSSVELPVLPDIEFENIFKFLDGQIE